MQEALFLDPLKDQGAPAGPSAEGEGQTTSATLRVNPHIFDTDRVRVEALLRSMARLRESDLESLQDAVEKLTEADGKAAWHAIETRLDTDNQALRDRFVDTGRALALTDLARHLGLDADEVRARTTRWEKHGDIMSAQHRGTTYYPVFQFRNSGPHPTVRLALAELPSDLAPWQRVFWFVSANGWVDNDAPCNRLDDSDLVIQAARYEGEPVVG